MVREAETRYETEWRRVFADSPESEECYRVGEEILQKVKDIEWEVQDIADSVATLEANPENFSLGPSELKARKEFIQGVRARLDKVKSSIMFAHGHVKEKPAVTTKIKNEDTKTVLLFV